MSESIDIKITLTHTLGIIWLLNELYISFPIPLFTDSGSSVIMVATILAVERIFMVARRGGTREGKIKYLKVILLLSVYVLSN